MNNKYDFSDVSSRILIESVTEIAKEKGCCVSTIYWYLKKNNIKIPEINLSNKKFNMIMVVEFSHSKNQEKYWKCLCDCGNLFDLSTNAINGGKYKSCGCYKKSKEFSRKNKLWSGYEDIHIKWWNNCIKGAKKRNIPFEISIEYAWNLFVKQNKKCNLSGVDLIFSLNTRGWQYGETTASIDRIDSNKGYIEGNIQWLHKDVNLMKHANSQEYFLNMIKLIYENLY